MQAGHENVGFTFGDQQLLLGHDIFVKFNKYTYILAKSISDFLFAFDLSLTVSLIYCMFFSIG